MAEGGNERMDKLVALCKRRGFIFQSSEIYGGIGGFWDYGPLGVELKRNVKAAWWENVVRKRDDRYHYGHSPQPADTLTTMRAKQAMRLATWQDAPHPTQPSPEAQ